MGLFDNLFGKDDEALLFRLNSFNARYLLTVSNEFTMGKENPVVVLQTESDISLQQQLAENHLLTTVTVNSITGKTENSTLKPHLEQMLVLGNISRKIVFERNERGSITGIANQEELNNEWEAWKKTSLAVHFPDPAEQVKFVEHFEKGLTAMEENIKNNLNYYILLPEIYHLKKHNSCSNITDEHTQPSKLISGMPLQYRFRATEITDTDTAVIKLETEILNMPDVRKKYLKHYYGAQTEFDITEYSFSIHLDYLAEKNSGKIISGNLFLKEKMHDHLQYLLHIRLDEIKEETPVTTNQTPHTRKRNFLADEIIHSGE